MSALAEALVTLGSFQRWYIVGFVVYVVLALLYLNARIDRVNSRLDKK